MLPKGINQYSFNWGSVTMTAMDSPCPGYKCEDPGNLRITPESVPKEKVTGYSSIP